MNLLGQGWDDPRSHANMALAAGLLKGDFGAGLLGANNVFAQARNDALKTQLVNAQIAETQAQAQERAMRAKKEQQALEQQARLQGAVPGLFGGGQFNVQEALRLGMTPEQISAYAGLSNVGRQKVARTVEVDDGRGGKSIMQVDEFGQPVGQGMPGYVAPVQVNQGDRVSFVRPNAGLSMPVGMSPGDRDSSARGWAGLNETRRHNAITESSAAAGRVPAGYRAKGDGTLEFIPGGPADPEAARRAAPTEFQGKSAIYGTRAQEADRIISDLDGKYSPAAINAKTGAGNVPLVGGALEAAGNLALSKSSQKAEQAQRDFINAVLRQESGAVISPAEFDNAKKQYFPQPFDSADVKMQKAQNRRIAIQGILNNARATTAVPQTGGATGSWEESPSIDALLKKYGGK